MSIKEEKIQQALDSLDNIQRASAGPFFYTRLSARLRNNSVTAWDRISYLLSRPVVAIGAVCLILAVNMGVVINQSEERTASGETPELALADEYAIATTNFYDYENADTR